MLVTRTEDVMQFDPDAGAEIVRRVEVSERVVDDELDDVANAYKQWLSEQDR